jgi:hypothetical protein
MQGKSLPRNGEKEDFCILMKVAKKSTACIKK